MNKDACGEEKTRNSHSVCLHETQKDAKIFKQSAVFRIRSLAPKTILIYDVIRLIQLV